MSNVGQLSFKIYNPDLDYKNQIYVNNDKADIQKLRLYVRNNLTDAQFKLKKGTGKNAYTFALKLKKGLLPAGFDSNSISVKKFRSITGKEIFKKDRLDLPFLQLGGIYKEWKKAVGKGLKMGAPMMMAGGGATVAKPELFLDSSEVKQLKSKIKGIDDLKTIWEQYNNLLLQLKKLSTTNPFLLNDRSMAKEVEEVATIFTKLGEMQQKLLLLTGPFEQTILQFKQQKLNQAKQEFDDFRQKHNKDLQQKLSAAFDPDTIIKEPIKNLKLKDVLNIDELELDQHLLDQLNGKMVVEEAVAKTDWTIEVVKMPAGSEEQEIRFTHKKDIEINPYGYLFIEIALAGQLQGKAGSANIELYYPSAELYKKDAKNKPVKDTTFKDKMSKTILTLVNQGSTGVGLPMELRVIKGAQMLSNGDLENEIKLDLKNTSGGALNLAKGTKLQVDFSTTSVENKGAYDLTTKDLAKTVEVALYEHKDVVTKTEKTKKLTDLQILNAKVHSREISLSKNKEGGHKTIIDQRFKKLQFIPRLLAFYGGKNNINVGQSAEEGSFKVYEYKNVYIESEGFKDNSKEFNIVKSDPKKLIATFTITRSTMTVTCQCSPAYKGKSTDSFSNGLKPVDEIIREWFINGTNYNYYSGGLVLKADGKKASYIHTTKEEHLECSVIGDINLLVKPTQPAQKNGVNLYQVSCQVEYQGRKEIKNKYPNQKAVNWMINYKIPNPHPGTKNIRIDQTDSKKTKLEFYEIKDVSIGKFTLSAGTINNTYTYEFGKNEELLLGKAVKIKLAKVKSNLGAGTAKINVKVLNVGGYKDTDFIAHIQRAPYFSDDKKGIRNIGATTDNLLVEYPKTAIKAGDYSLEVDKEKGLTLKQKDKTLLNLSDPESMYRQCLPIGSIIMWYGDRNKKPEGWAICDGSNGTPDFTQKFPRGLVDDKEKKKQVKDNYNGYGSDAIRIKTSNLPDISNSLKVTIDEGGTHNHYWKGWLGRYRGGLGNSKSGESRSRKSNSDTKDKITNSDGAHSHTANINPKRADTFKNDLISIVPKYVGVWYIMRID